MKIVSTIIAVLLSYNLSALACGGKKEAVYTAKTKGAEVAVSVGQQEVIILNSGSKMIKAKNEYSSAVVPVRFELSSSSKVRKVVIQTQFSTTYLGQYAMFRCINTPTQTDEVYLAIGEYSSDVKIYLLKQDEKELSEDRQADLVLTGEQILKMLAKK
jgi:hypothetical protein